MAQPSARVPSREPGAAHVVVYTLATCGACTRARSLLEQRGIAFEEISLGRLGGREALFEATGGSTVPQIVIDGEPIGGAAALARLNRQGALLPLVRREPFPRAVVRRRLSPTRLLVALASLVGGGRCRPWRHDVELIDRDGRTLERLRAPSADSAAELAGTLNGR